MSWDSFVENTGYYLEVASNRMARRALHTEVKSLNKMSEDDVLGEWIGFLPEKGLTKSLKRDINTILSKKVAEKAAKTATHKQDESEKTYPID